MATSTCEAVSAAPRRAAVGDLGRERRRGGRDPMASATTLLAPTVQQYGGSVELHRRGFLKLDLHLLMKNSDKMGVAMSRATRCFVAPVRETRETWFN